MVYCGSPCVAGCSFHVVVVPYIQRTRDAGRREHGGVVVGVQPLQPRRDVVARGLLDDHDDAAMRPERYDLGRDLGSGGGIPVQERGHAQLQRRSDLGEPAHLREAGAELHEVVMGLLHGVADEVVDDVADVLAGVRSRRCGW